MEPKTTIYDFAMKDARGNMVDLEAFRGRVLLVVNTATGCGFTPQYAGLQALYQKYAAQGFEILDFPCNQFLHQAPGPESEIVEFCQRKYNVTFRQFAKTLVNGKDADPLFVFLKRQKGGTIKWNFTKFLIDRNGNVVHRFAPPVKPEKMEEKIVELLQQPAEETHLHKTSTEKVGSDKKIKKIIHDEKNISKAKNELKEKKSVVKDKKQAEKDKKKVNKDKNKVDKDKKVMKDKKKVDKDKNMGTNKNKNLNKKNAK